MTLEFAELFSNISAISIILFTIGVILITAELFIPGFGVCGVLGVIVLIIDIFITAQTIAQGLILTAVCFIIFMMIFAVFLFMASKGVLPRKLILQASISAERGFSGTEDLDYLLGKNGIIVTICRPAGNADFEGVKLDVVSKGEYIEKGTLVEVIEVEGNKIVVKPKKT